MLPRNLVKDLGPVTMSVTSSLDEGVAGEYDFMTNTLALSHKHIASYSPEQLRGLVWHEMAHWLYFSASLNPKASKTLKQWRQKIDTHWEARTKSEPECKHPDGWKYIPDGWIKFYAGRLYPGHTGGIEIPSVYLEEVAHGPDSLARWCEKHPSEHKTFDLVMSTFAKITP